jgi:hypothetical protein
MSKILNQIEFQTSDYWGAGVWTVHVFGRDLGRVSQCETPGCCGGWHGWKDVLPRRQGPDVKNVKTRQEAGEALRDLWEDSHGPAPQPPQYRPGRSR